MKLIKWFVLTILLAGCAFGINTRSGTVGDPSENGATSGQGSNESHPLQIEVMRQQSYPGSKITIEEILDSGVDYNRFLVSYLSEGLKIYALMTEPFGDPPDSGWPVIIFNHGYIHPPDYRTTENYIDYMDMLARDGYIVFKSDYRGHDESEGEIIGAGYGSPGYTTDVLNALTSLKNYQNADPNRIGAWAHSMGGQVTLRAMVVSPDIKAAVIWAGSIAPYHEIVRSWGDPGQNPTDEEMPLDMDAETRVYDTWVDGFGDWVEEFSAKYGTYEQNPDFWDTISPNHYLTDLSGPILLLHGTADEKVPLSWSEEFAREMEAANMPYEIVTYEDDDHNLSYNFRSAMQTTVAFFDEHVKGSD